MNKRDGRCIRKPGCKSLEGPHNCLDVLLETSFSRELPNMGNFWGFKQVHHSFTQGKCERLFQGRNRRRGGGRARTRSLGNRGLHSWRGWTGTAAWFKSQIGRHHNVARHRRKGRGGRGRVLTGQASMTNPTPPRVRRAVEH